MDFSKELEGISAPHAPELTFLRLRSLQGRSKRQHFREVREWRLHSWSRKALGYLAGSWLSAQRPDGLEHGRGRIGMEEEE